MNGLALQLPDELVEQVAERVAEILAERAEGHLNAGDATGFLDVEGAADYLSCPKSRIYSLVSAGRLPVHRDGSRLLFTPAELNAYVADGGAKRP